MGISSMQKVILVLLFAFFLAGCAANPVTGRTELRLISEREEIQLGQENYAPLRQAEGGDLQIDRELSAYVNEVGQRIARVSDRPNLPYEFVVVNNSVPNAWALPGGKIGINRGLLLEMDSEAELAAVLAHEIVHAAARHSAQRMERGLLTQLGVAAIGIGTQDSRNAGLIGGVASVGAALLTQRYGREAELEADRFGMLYMHRAGYDPSAAIALQETFVRLSEGRQSNWLEGLFASHPPSRERVEANRVYAAELGSEGTEMHRERYHARLTWLRESKVAYDAYDSGRAALAANRPAEAVALAEGAIRQEPREALFHGLLADANRLRGPRAALPHFDRAIQMNPNYFAFHLGRGMVHKDLGNRDQALRDLQRSNALLPTASANTALGELAESLGQRSMAITHYRFAAASSSHDGQVARQQLARLELGTNANTVIAAAARLAEGGKLALALENTGSLPARDIIVRVTWLDERGRTIQQREVTVRGTLPAGGRTHMVPTDIVLTGGEAELKMLRILVVSASAAL